MTTIRPPASALVLAATPESPRIVRDELRRWLGELGWPAQAADEIVFCVSEVVTNIVEHAYADGDADDPGRAVHLSARIETISDPRLASRLRWACVDLHDSGRWREPDPRQPGLGLLLLPKLLDNVVVITRGTPDYGTTVSLRSRPVDARKPHATKRAAMIGRANS